MQTTVNNPQSNAICKRMHKTILNIVRITMQTTEIKDKDDTRQVIDNVLATMVHTTRCSVYIDGICLLMFWCYGVGS